MRLLTCMYSYNFNAINDTVITYLYIDLLFQSLHIPLDIRIYSHRSPSHRNNWRLGRSCSYISNEAHILFAILVHVYLKGMAKLSHKLVHKHSLCISYRCTQTG